MNSNSKILLTKDAMCTDYLPCYGNSCWAGKTPNIDELASKGTLYSRFYTVAGSSDMSYLAMFTGKYPYELGIADYAPLKKPFTDNLFSRAAEKGYECHIIWDEAWMNDFKRCRCFGAQTQIHPISGLRQKLGFKYAGQEKPIGEDIVDKSVGLVVQAVEQISQTDRAVFLWIHLPHVINGRSSYGSDIDVFDRLVGLIRNFFSDDNIYLSADHGNMNGFRNILGYGFHAYEPVARIPLITPRKEGLRVCSDLVGNVDMEKLLFTDDIPRREYIFVDTAYYAQDHRILAIVGEQYKYIYHKSDRSEELYDIKWDPNEQFNLIQDTFYDAGRKASFPAKELYFYYDWEKLPAVREEYRSIRLRMWKDVPRWRKLYQKARRFGGKLLRLLKKKK